MAFTTILNVANLYPTFQRGVPNQKPPDTLIQQIINDFADIILAILERRFSEAIAAAPGATTDGWLISLGIPNKNWASGISINQNDIVLDSNDPMSAQQATNSGTTGDDEPDFSSDFNGTVDDNGITWKNIGQSRQLRVLELGNRYGAGSQIGRIMASFGVASASKLADEYDESDWQPFRAELNAEQVDKRFRGQPKDYGLYDVLFDPQANVQTPRPLLSGIAGGDQPVGATPDVEGVSAVFGKFGRDFGRHGRNWPTPENTQ